jgi:hypothetical protein
MRAVGLTKREDRAAARLAELCDALDRFPPDVARPTAYERLQEHVGVELAHFVVCALRSRPATRFEWPAA